MYVYIYIYIYMCMHTYMLRPSLEVVLPMAQFAQPSRPLLGLLEDGCKASENPYHAHTYHTPILMQT